MARESFRFIHASDFHIERPLHDLMDVPENHRNALVEAPWKAAEAVFEQACLEQVDFVLLTGDLLNPHASGAAGPAFLLDQFEVLREANIQVYWCGGEVDSPERWPDAVKLPDNVHLFSDDEVEKVVFRRNGSALATLLGRSSDGRESIQAAEYDMDEDDNFRIALGYGRCDAESLSAQRVDYWALGGKHHRDWIQKEGPTIRYCGTTQARSLSEPGAHGCDLIEIDSDHKVNVQSIDLDVFRYAEPTIDADDLALGRDLRQLMSKRLNKLQAESNGRHLLVSWRVHMNLEDSAIVGPAAIEELVAWLRREFGSGQPSAWTIDIEVIPPKNLPKKWQEEDTILGDFLRTSDEHRKASGRELSLQPMIEAETPATSVWQSTLKTGEGDVKRELVEQATLLGVDLLRGHKLDLLATTRRFGGLPSNK